MNTNNYIGIAIDELYRIFDILNTKFYASKLPYPVITIQRSTKNSVGWCSVEKIWVQKNGSEQKYEINICGESLSDSTTEVVHTLLHELVHYAGHCEGIDTCSGSVHNKKYKESAEAVGLIVEKSPKVGWGDTHLSNELVTFIQNTVKVDESKFQYFRTKVEAPKKDKEKAPNENKMYKYTCPKCGELIKAKKDKNILCGACKTAFEPEEDEE